MSRRGVATFLGLLLGFSIEVRIGAHDRISTLPLQIDENLQVKSGQVVMEPTACVQLAPRVCEADEETCSSEIQPNSSSARDASKGRRRVHFSAKFNSSSNSKERRCALRVGEDRRLTFAWRGLRFTLIDAAMIELVEESTSAHFRILQGRVRVTEIEATQRPESESSTAVAAQSAERPRQLPQLLSHLGQFEMKPGVDVSVHVHGTSDSKSLGSESLQAVTLFNESDQTLTMQLKGWSEPKELPPWTEVVIRRPGYRTAQALVEIPVPLQWDSFVERRARLHHGHRNQFAKDLQRAAQGRVQAAEFVGQAHRLAADRKVASIRAEEAREREAERQAKVQSAEVKRLFRERFQRQQLGE
ncbi:MAG TPA: hypothetical protein PLZ57_13665 [Pseudobdellovibrionaceae bacterium]|nr:hypothetical protein [Pseudobdellovibrionaceae bacterium]